MLNIICGQDTVRSRKHYAQLQEQARAKNFRVELFTASKIEQVASNATQGADLFGNKIIFFTEGLKKIAKQKDKMALLQELTQDKSIELVSWEDTSAWELPAAIKKLTSPTEFKPQQNIFILLDTISPNNATRFINLLEEVMHSEDEFFIYTMVCRHVRNLLTAKISPESCLGSPWQKKKIVGQASSWEIKNLLALYQGLIRIDINFKTSCNYLPMRESLEILAFFGFKK